MRLLRWGAELAAKEDPRSYEIGTVALDALTSSPLLDQDDVELVVAVGRAATLSGT